MGRGKKEVVESKIVEDYTAVHPALDFLENMAVVSIGEQVQNTYDNGEIEFKDGEVTVLSTGENFLFSRSELAQRKLYYNRTLDLPLARWKYDDLTDFCNAMKNGNKPIVNPHDIYQRIYETIDYYVEFENPNVCHFLATFIIYTYFYPLFPNAPIVQLWGEMASGKTKVCSIISALAFNPVNSANISVASVFRLVEGRRATLILDESEDLMNSERGRDISNLLLAGYNKSGETYRQEKQPGTERYKTLSFKVFSPKIIANISGVSLDPLKSRIIRIIMTGCADKTKANREVNEEDKIFRNIRNMLYRMTLLQFPSMVKKRDEFIHVEHMSGRQFGIWQGILTVALWLDKKIYDSIYEFAKANVKQLTDEIAQENPGNILLDKLLLLVEKKGEGEYHIDNLIPYMATDDDLGIWTKRKIALTLNRLGFAPTRKWHDGCVKRYYYLTSSSLIDKMQKR